MDFAFDPGVLRNFAVALLIGALVGIEREKKKSLEGDLGIGGIRTFILIALAGALSAWISQVLAAFWILAVTMAGVCAVVVAGYVAQAKARPTDLGMTTEVAAIAVCLLGAACLLGYPGIAVALGVAVSATLAYKRPIHGIVGRLGTDDIYAGLRLLIATFIVLPLLPDRAVDPWGALNPRELWLLVILISGLSLVGYVAVRALGSERGSAVTGLAGGMVSSTAVTLSFAKRSRDEGEDRRTVNALATGILLAWGVMFARVGVLTAVLFPGLLPPLVLPMTAMSLPAILLAAVHYRRSAAAPPLPDPPGGVRLANPFSLTSASKFALLFGAVLLLVRVVQRYFPAQGLYLVAVLAGLPDVDPVTLSMARFAREGGDPGTASTAVVLACLANTALKGGMAAALGGRLLARSIRYATAAILAAGGAAILLF